MRRLPLLRPLVAGLLLSALLPATASVIATNVQISFDEQASFADGIDRTLSLSEAQAARLLASRLGSWIETSAVLTLTSSHSVSISDPGVAAAPGTDRRLLRVDASASVSGALLASDPFVQNVGATWVCQGHLTRCDERIVTKALDKVLPALAEPGSPEQARALAAAAAAQQVLAAGGGFEAAAAARLAPNLLP